MQVFLPGRHWKIFTISFALFLVQVFVLTTRLHAQGYVHASGVYAATGVAGVRGLIADNGYSYLLHTSGNDFTVTAGPVPGFANSILTKLDEDGNIIWSRHLPFGSTASTYSEMVLENGILYLLGYTAAADVPVTDGSLAGGGGSDILFAKIDAASGSILHNSYHGGNGAESSGLALAVENSNVYITYTTQSSDIVTSTGTSYTSGYDHVIEKLGPAGNTLYRTYSGRASAAAANTEAVSLAVENGQAWLAMLVSATHDFSTTDGSGFVGDHDLGIVRLNTSGNIVFSTIYGGTGQESTPTIQAKNGELFLTAYSTSINFPVTDGSAKGSQNKDHIVLKFNNNNARAFSRYLAGVGVGSDVPQLVVADNAVYLLVSTHSSTPTVITTDGTSGGSYLMKLNAATGSTQFSTAFGGTRAFANATGSHLKVENGSVYTSTPALNAGTTVTTDGSVRRSNMGTFLTKHGVSGELQYASWLTGGVGSAGGFMDVSNGRIHYAGATTGTTWPVTRPTEGTASSADVVWGTVALCPPMPTINTVAPLTQTICREGIPTSLSGNKVAYTSDNMPTLFINGVSTPQNEIRARYQWQRADNPAGPWTNITGTGTQQDYTPPAGSSDQYYRRLVLAPVGCTPELISTSEVAAVLVSEDNSPAVTAGIFNTCVGTAVDISASVAGGTAPFTYAWDNGIVSATENATVTPTANSVYTITVTDNNGCQQVGQVIVNAYAADAGPATASVCAGAPVRIGTAPPAGLAGVTYSWSPATGLDDPTLAQPMASPASTTTYTLSMTVPVSGGGTCTTTDDITVDVVEAPTGDFGGADKTICKGGTTTLGEAAQTGFSYTWVPGNYLSSTTAATVTFNAGSEFPAPNSFSYTVNAAKDGCTFSEPVTVSVIQANAGKDYCGPRTVGVTDPTPGVSGKTFLWEVVSGPGIIVGATNTAQTTVSASVGGSTVYRLTVSHNGVSCTDEVTVPECSSGSGGCPDPEIRVVSDYTCPSAALAPVTLTAHPSNLSAAEWTYSWSSSTGTGISSTTGTSITLTDNVEKDITLTITHKDNPLISCSETIHVNDPAWSYPVFSAPDQAICPGQTVSIGLPAVPGYSYNWKNVNDGDENLSNPSVSPIFTTNYPVVVTDDVSGCAFQDTIQVKVQAVVNDPGPDWEVCSNSIVKLGSPALPGYTYSWTPISASYQDGTDHASAEPKVLIATTQDFTLTATDTETGCTEVATVHITVDASSTLPAMNDVTICRGENTVIGNPEWSGATYSWSPATHLSSATIAQPVASPDVTTTYTLVATLYDAFGSPTCTKTGTVTVTVNAPEIALDDAVVCPSGDLYDLGEDVTVTGATSYQWSPAILLNNSNTLNATLKANPNMPTTFMLTAADANGCSASASKTVSPTNPPPIAGSSGVVCLGSSTTLGDYSNSGALSWAWTVEPDEGLTGTLSSYTDPAPVFTPAPADVGKTFTFTLTQDIGGCTNSATVKITVRGFELNNIPVQTVCSNASAMIGVAPVSGISYQWTPATGLSNPTAATTMVNNITATSVYTLTATDASGCVSETDAVVGVNPTSAPDIHIPDVVVMVGSEGIPFAPEIDPGSGNYSYSWTPTTTVDNPYTANAKAIPGGIGITVYNLNVVDDNGCTSSAPARLTVVSYAALPVKLNSYSVKAEGCGVQLNWDVGSAESFSRFVIERSADGIRFNEEATIYYNPYQKGYRYEDPMTGNGKWSYRLKMIDIDGQFEYSSVKSASVSCENRAATLSVYPNPANSEVYLKSNKAIRIVILYSVTGHVAQTYRIGNEKPATVNIRLRNDLTKGMYILQIVHHDGTTTHSKIIKR